MTDELSRTSAEHDETEPVEIVSVILNDMLPIGADVVPSNVEHTLNNAVTAHVEHTSNNAVTAHVEHTSNNAVTAHVEHTSNNAVTAHVEHTLDNAVTAHVEHTLDNAVTAHVEHTLDNAVTAHVEHTLDNDLSSKVTVELPPDWLKPMEEDDVDEGVELEKTNDIPKVKRRRGRPPRAKNIRKRLLMEGLMKTKGFGTPSRSSRSSKITTPRPHLTQTPEVSPKTPQSTSQSQTSTPKGPQVTPNSPAEGSTISRTANTEFRSSPRLTRVCQLNPGVAGTQNPCHSPVVKAANISQQKTNSSNKPGNDSTEPPLRLWLYPSMEPISLKKPQDTLSDQTIPIDSPNIPEAAHNGRKPVKEEIIPLISDCFNCGCPFLAKKAGDMLCPGCTPEKKQSPPSIVFRKVGQDQWAVGKTKPSKKQILKSYPRYVPKKVLKKDFVPDGDDDDDDDDECGGGNKKRNRRMCQQCVACLRDNDCGECDFCKDKPKFGGNNKKRQKCRLRQCQFQSKLQYRSSRVERSPSFPRRRKYKKPGRLSKKRKNSRHPWDNDYDDDNDDDDDDDVITDKEDVNVEFKRLKKNGSRSRGRRKWNYSFKEEDTFVEAVIDDVDDDEPDNEEAPITLRNERLTVTSNDISQSDAFPLVQNETMKIVVANGTENSNGFSVIQPPQNLYYTMPGLPGTLGEDVNQNGFLQIEMVRVGSPLSQYIDEPQNTAQHVTEPLQEESTPVITQIFSLAESNSDQDPGLLELLTALRQTVLPAHWVGVMAKGPVLQLLQCSKLSTMADTVVQIDKSFFYQISVQNQPLLLMHSIYMRHFTCLTTVDQVVSLLLDLEALSVCQGYQNLELRSPWEPRMCVRSALCDLLIPKDEDQCEKCELST
ncbi:uncharacterized protein LOC127621463 isoform X2 [Xyrauchen texanus]|uniref:uncharacterized protein LOC127621463 isoform X2 n=1 Tax=Xyrauchen texanus TaxID=154827 RepID=UPI002242BC41|nr:uncharacterized protein LOC127621463 isoform X2 [Xyrauchen texanus]